MVGWLKNNKLYLACIVLASLFFYNIGSLQINADKTSDTKINATDFPMLSSRLFERESNDIIINFTQLREVMKQRHAEKNLPVGIYFEYLTTGSSIGVNDQMEVEIGSLGKVPAVMAVYKEIESGSLRMDDALTLTERHLDQQFGELWKKGPGYKLTVQDAISAALRNSDNTAINVLLDRINAESPEGVFDELDLPKETDGQYPVMSPKSYASVFRNLYLSSYLDYAHSNNILEEMKYSSFKDKLPAGLPESVSMSHKIGVFVQADGKTVFNDCGIVYVPKRPYLLCIMAAVDEETAKQEMIAYSKMVYSYVSRIASNENASE